MSTKCAHVFVYQAALGGYGIVCCKCGDVYGFSESADPRFLLGFNRNRRAQKARRPNGAGRKESTNW